MVKKNENGVYLINKYDQPGTGTAVIEMGAWGQGSTARHHWLLALTWDHAHTSSMVKTLLTRPADMKMDTQRSLGPTEAGGRPTVSSPLPLLAALVLCALLPATLCKDSQGSTWVWLVG